MCYRSRVQPSTTGPAPGSEKSLPFFMVQRPDGAMEDLANVLDGGGGKSGRLIWSLGV
jgi:hypothetical protein